MICEDCKARVHCSTPGCTCQHHPPGSFLRPPEPPERELAGFMCPGCDLAVASESESCQCDSDERIPIYRDEIDDLV